MNIEFGKHAGDSVERIMLREPDYIDWLISKTGLTGAAKQIRDAVVGTFIPKFDAKLVQETCAGCREKRATYATGYLGNAGLIYWWCEDCDPYSKGANPGKLMALRDYEDLLDFAKVCGGKKNDFKKPVKIFSEGLGAPKRLTNQDAVQFFV